MKHFKNIWTCVGLGIYMALFTTTSVTQASPVTLVTEEIATLRTLVAHDADASDQFERLRKIANPALTDKPKPIEQVASEGHLDTDPSKIRSLEALKDMSKVQALVWAWAVSGDKRYFAKTREFILAWSKTNQSDGNPINETSFEPMIEAYDLIRPELSSTDIAQIDAWMRNKANLLWDNTRNVKGNWQSHRLKIVGLIGATINDVRLKKLASDGFKKQIEGSFEPDGESTDFKHRDAMHYHLYSVKPLLTLSCVLQRGGEPLFTYRAANGSSLERAVDFIRPYALSKLKHMEFSSSQVKFDRTRAAAGAKEYSPHLWDPKGSVSTFSEAGCLDPKYDEIASTVAGNPHRRFMNWRAVLNSTIKRPTH